MKVVPVITIIATVYNESSSIDALMHSLVRQTRRADEVIIVDGGSTDDTVARLQAFSAQLPLRIIVEQGANISRGRNLAMQAATSELLAITDAGVRLPDTWLEDITRLLRDDPSVGVACGFFRADPQTLFEAVLGATTLPLVHEINPSTFLPSSRSVAVRRSAALAVDGYPEWLDYCEDLIFDLRLKQAGVVFVFVPTATVQFRPRPDLRAFWTQYYRYARGDGKANLFMRRYIIRYGVYLVALPLLILLGMTGHLLAWLVLLMGGLTYCATPWRRLPLILRDSPHRGVVAWAYALVMVPLIRLIGDGARMCGYPVGRWWRYQHRPA